MAGNAVGLAVDVKDFKVKMWKEEVFRLDIKLTGVLAHDVMCMIWSWSHQPYLVLCGNIKSGGRDTAASLIKTVQCPGC